MVGDPGAGSGGVGEGINLPPSPGVQGSALELKSDPMGVDFRPYLTQILATIRRNWYAVMPESVKLGRRGKVGLLFTYSGPSGMSGQLADKIDWCVADVDLVAKKEARSADEDRHLGIGSDHRGMAEVEIRTMKDGRRGHSREMIASVN